MNKYEMISNEMRKRVQNGFYSIEQPIPDEVSLSEEFKVSRMTMKRALDILVMEGLLYRKRGHGTFIIKSAIQRDMFNVPGKESQGLTELANGKKVTSKVLEFQVQFPSEEVANHLSIDQNTPVYYIIRVRYIEDEPYVIEKTYMPTTVITGINDQVLHSSIYQHIKSHLKLTIASLHKKIRADKPNDLDKHYLICASDDPILEVEQVVYLNSGAPFEYSFSRHRYDKFVFTTVNIVKN